MVCHGNLDTHCCTVNGAPCPYLEENTIPGRRWVCALRRELGSWDLVHQDPRYLTDVQPGWDKYPYPNMGCGTWPQGCLTELRHGACCFN